MLNYISTDHEIEEIKDQDELEDLDLDE